MRQFTNLDWALFAGAVPFADHTEPCRANTLVDGQDWIAHHEIDADDQDALCWQDGQPTPGGNVRLAVVADGHGVTIMDALGNAMMLMLRSRDGGGPAPATLAKMVGDAIAVDDDCRTGWMLNSLVGNFGLE